MGPPRLHRLVSRWWGGVNVYLLEESDGVTLVDTGYPWSGPALARALARYPRVTRILLTHFHPDHSGSAAYLSRMTGAPVLAHEAEVDYLMGRKRLEDEPGWWVTRSMLRLLRVIGLGQTEPPDTVIPLREGDRVGAWQVMHTPGHTPGSASFWNSERGLLLCGDNLVNQAWGFTTGVPWWTLDHDLRRRSILRYAELPVKTVLSGHGPPWSGDLQALLASW